MNIINFEKLSDAGLTFSQLPIAKQFLVLLAIATSIGIGTVIALWAKEPVMAPLYFNLDTKDSSKIVEALEKSNIGYKLDGNNVYISENKVHDTRIKLASLGLPAQSNIGYELFDKPNSFASSQFSESVKFKRSVEGELVKTIVQINGIKNARVHIGLPRQNSFVTKDQLLSASIMVDVQRGFELDRSQIAGIIHLVASSVPGMKHENVSLIDQRGILLSNFGGQEGLSALNDELAITKAKEAELEYKIEQLITPIVGSNGVKAKVTAELDFTFRESTLEQYDNNKNNVKNEMLVAEYKPGVKSESGVPGALSNKAPVDNKIEEKETNTSAANSVNKSDNHFDKLNRSYELDKTITYKKDPIGKVIKISVAVILNDKIEQTEDGEELRKPLSDEEVKKIESLVKNATGYSKARGDELTVVYSPFINNALAVSTDEANHDRMTKYLELPMLQQISKLVGAALLVLLLIFGILRPIVAQLSSIRKDIKTNMDKYIEENNAKSLQLPEPDTLLTNRTNHVRETSKNDSKKAAKVLMNWMGNKDE